MTLKELADRFSMIENESGSCVIRISYRNILGIDNDKDYIEQFCNSPDPDYTFEQFEGFAESHPDYIVHDFNIGTYYNDYDHKGIDPTTTTFFDIELICPLEAYEFAFRKDTPEELATLKEQYNLQIEDYKK